MQISTYNAAKERISKQEELQPSTTTDIQHLYKDNAIDLETGEVQPTGDGGEGAEVGGQTCKSDETSMNGNLEGVKEDKSIEDSEKSKVYSSKVKDTPERKQSGGI